MFFSEKEKKEDPRKLTKKQEQAIKDILTIIHKDKNTSGKVDIANYLDKIKQHVSVTRENLDEIETEVNSLLEEINAWDDTTPLKKAKGNACKEVEALRESRLKLRDRKLDLKSGHDKEDVARKEKRSQDQMIKEMWAMIRPTFGKVNSGGDEIGKALAGIKKYVSDSQIRLSEFNDIESEVTLLLEEINAWDDTTPLKKAKGNACKEVEAVRESRLRLHKRKLDLKSGHDKKDVARKEKRSQDQMIKDMWAMTRPTSGKVYSGADEIGKALAGIKKCVSDSQIRLSEFNEIEGLAFRVEEMGNLIFSYLSGEKHSQSDDPRTLVDTFKSVHKKLVSCKTETETLVKIVSRLEVNLNIDRKSGSVKSDSVSNRCKAIKETVEKRKQMFDEMQSMLDKSTNSLTLSYSELLDEPYLFLEPRTNADSIRRKVPEWLHGHAALIDRISACTRENKTSFQLRYVRKEDYNNLKDQMRTLHEEMRQLREDKESAYNRLSKVAGARLTDNNPNIADLSDPNRPTKIAEQYSELYDIPWTDAYEILKDKDQENTDILLKIIVDCYEICGKISMNHQRNLKNAVCYPANNIEDGQSSEQ
ncbi:uncharacterized protein LOC132727383, partial [Ruditapes philippinarum]|uniref:uncharacterized protein LOC132727383 n=1 Tax=Ruditapes philippinarum TaxID=129788 RepID=UPI00295BF6C8